jgi:hypothetical protein
MAKKRKTNFNKSLEQLTGIVEGEPDEAPTYLVEYVRRAWRKPLNSLLDEEIARLCVQQYGMPYILDLVWPTLQENPLYAALYYEGDILSILMRADKSIWMRRPEYEEELESLHQRALKAPSIENDIYIKTLDPNQQC